MKAWSKERFEAYERYAKEDMKKCEEWMREMISLQRKCREAGKMARYYYNSAKELKEKIAQQKDLSEEERLKEVNDFLLEVQLNQDQVVKP